MKVRKFKFLIVLHFLAIFTVKMLISVAPLFYSELDKVMMNNVIMQLEVEHHTEQDGSKAVEKLSELKYLGGYVFNQFALSNTEQILDNSFIEHAKRYINPHHPSVPTPPPNFS